MLSNIRIVLVNTSHPGNIGSSARAMKTMGLEHLYLVTPAHFPSTKAVELAAGADDVLANAVVVNTLQEALADCQYIIGTTARAIRGVPLPELTPRAAGVKIIAEAKSHQVAVVFGCERFGLTSEELLKCHEQLTIPTEGAYRALNLAAAVQVIAYEILVASQQQISAEKENREDELASSENIEYFYHHLTDVLTKIGFYNPDNPMRLIPKLRRLFNRIRLEKAEVQMLRGILTAVTKATKNTVIARSLQRSNPAIEAIYLDYMATTPVDPAVTAKMLPYLSAEAFFGNAASEHAYGEQAAQAITLAREQVAALVHAQATEIIWTSGATEAINLAIIGAARFYQSKGKHVITIKTEHKAVLDSCRQLEREGFAVTYLTPLSNGLIALDTIKTAIRPDTILLSIMHVNNEIGVIQDIQTISEFTRSQGILCHVDAAQSAGKIAINLQEMPVDLMSFSAHKLYGPKGIGALFVRRQPRVRLMPLLHGGGHEQGLRSGTLATHQIVGMGEAFHLARERFAEEAAHIQQLAAIFWREIGELPGIYLNGDKTQRYAGNINISVAGVEGESLRLALRDLALSNMSACVSASIEPSYVLRAIGVADELAHSAVRISFGRFTTAAEMEFAAKLIIAQVTRLRQISAVSL